MSIGSEEAGRGKLTGAQRKALQLVAKRDWPAGEPRLGWIHCGTARVLLDQSLIAERPGTAVDDHFGRRSAIVELTPAGRAALSAGEGSDA